MNWNELPEDLINLILSMRREILRVDSCKIVLNRVYDMTMREPSGLPMITPELATEMELAIEVLSGKESPILWKRVFNIIEHNLWEDEWNFWYWDAHGGAMYYNRIEEAYLTLVERFDEEVPLRGRRGSVRGLSYVAKF